MNVSVGPEEGQFHSRLCLCGCDDCSDSGCVPAMKNAGLYCSHRSAWPVSASEVVQLATAFSGLAGDTRLAVALCRAWVRQVSSYSMKN